MRAVMTGAIHRANRAAATGAPSVPGRRGHRRGQTLIMALSILFLMVLLGGVFVTLVLSNLQRVGRQGNTDDALSLAMAGLQYASEQLKNSPEGADWRPRATDPLWSLPNAANAAIAAARQLDPDFEYLNPRDATTGRVLNPYVRIPMGRGRCLLRVTYRPQFQPASAASEAAGVRDQFDPNSGMLLIESVGRPGEYDPNDPTFLRDPAQPRITGPVRKIEALVSIGLLDQLWWITNRTNERGPANLGVPAFRQPNTAAGEPTQLVEYPTVYQGSIRSNTSVKFNGRSVLRVYPSRGEGLFVKGDISLAAVSNRDAADPTASDPVLRIDVVADTGGPNTGSSGATVVPPDGQDDDPTNDTRLLALPGLPSTDPNFETPLYQRLLTSGRASQKVVRDERHLRTDAEARSRSTRVVDAPVLDQVDPITGASRWHQLTRDSGGRIQVQGGRVVNSGWYGLTDAALPPSIRARGLYVDNYADIQYPDDRRRVKSEWLQRSGERTGWYADQYVPAVKDATTGTLREIAELQLVPVFDAVKGRPMPKIRITRTDPDIRQLNVPIGSSVTPRHFYSLTNVTGTPTGGTANLVNPVQVRDFDYPENGVIYCEGSVRVRGMVGYQDLPKQLTIVSGGTIYIEGNIIRPPGQVGSQVALLAQDYVCLNPTAFTRVDPGPDVVVEPHGWDPDSGQPTQWHYSVPQDRYLDITVSSARALPVNGANPNYLLHMRHSAIEGDVSSETAINIFQPILAPAATPWPDWTRDRIDFNAPPFGAVPTRSFLFHQIAAGTRPSWAETNFLSRQGQPGNFEGRSVALTAPLPAGLEGVYRILCGPKDDPNGGANPVSTYNGQPYWLSRVAALPTSEPLPIKVEAVMYAYSGSWFVIPPPFFNLRPEDSRARYLTTGRRQDNVFQDPPGSPALSPNPAGTQSPLLHPFYNEPLNIDIQVIGSIVENFPAEPSEAALWTSRLWVTDLDFNRANGNSDNDPSIWPPTSPDNAANWITSGRSLFSPRISYRYEGNMRRMVRVRFLRPYRRDVANDIVSEEICWSAPLPAGATAPPSNLRDVDAVVAEAMTNNSYVEILPLLPRLPVGQLLYEGNPLL